MFRIGHGFDVHSACEGDFVILGGERIKNSFSLSAHSDGDVLLHAICDALLGALSLGDIGKHFPNIDDRYKNISSGNLLEKTYQMVIDKNYQLVNLDCTILAEKPNISDFVGKIKENIGYILKTHTSNISVKATTMEKLGPVGKCQGIEAYAVVLLKNSDLNYSK